MAKEKQFIIHFVGHDNAGKTSIAKELSEHLKIPYFQNPANADYLKNDAVNLTRLRAEGMMEFHLLNQCGFSIIRDRNYICEIVYASMYNRDTDISFLRNLHNAYCSNFPNFYIVYCYKTTFKEKFEDEYVKEEDVSGLKTLYEGALMLLSNQEKILRLNTTSENLELQIQKIKDFIQW